MCVQGQAWVLALAASAVGRTGEPLHASCAIAVGPTLAVLSFSLSMPAPIPGQPFSAHPVVQPLVGPPAGAESSCPGLTDSVAAPRLSDLRQTPVVTFTLALIEWGQQPARNWSLIPIEGCNLTRPDTGVALQSQACGFLLPRAGEYALTGCAWDSAGDKSCTTMRLGRPEQVRGVAHVCVLWLPSLWAPRWTLLGSFRSDICVFKACHVQV